MAEYFQSVELERVTLRVRDLATLRAFYAGVLGLAVRGSDTARVELAASPTGPVLLVLEASPAAAVRPAGTAGLFHTALLFPIRAALGRMARQLIARRVRFATGDHGVSEALYLDDPEGNGVELYADRARADWPATAADGSQPMWTRPVDLESLLEAGPPRDEPPVPPETRIGHVHLCVSALGPAEKFYATALGFPVRLRGYPGALFLGRDGYHHHFGLNTWQSDRPSAPGVLGLTELTIVFHQRTAWTAAARAVQAEKDPKADTMARVRDPDGIALVLRLAER